MRKEGRKEGRSRFRAGARCGGRDAAERQNQRETRCQRSTGASGAGHSRWFAGLAVVVSLFAASTTIAVPLTNVWETSLRKNIKVYLCITRFAQQFPTWDLNVLRANVRNALDTWNAYNGVDLYLAWQGDLTCSQPDCGGAGDPSSCRDGQPPTADGEVVIRAQDCHPGALATTSTETPGGYIRKAWIGFYRTNGATCSSVIPWTFDHTTTGQYDFDSVLMHELGHAVGFGNHDPWNNGVASVMESQYQPSMYRLLWEEDLSQLRTGYNLVTTRQTLHKVSTDNGLSWSPEGNLQEFTNAKIGVAFSPSQSRYLIAWTAAEPWSRIHTILGNGLTYWSSTRVAHDGCNSYYGPAAVYGKGKYVIAWTLTNDTRWIAYRTSSTGYPADQWSAVLYVQYKGGYDYGSMWEPALAYNANKRVFLVAWTNWQVSWTGDDYLGRVRICVSDDPATEGFGNCVELYMASNSPPAIACHSTANECILAWTNHIGYYDHHISYRKGRIGDSGAFELIGTGYYFVSGGSTRLAPHLGFGNGYWMLSFRDNNSVGVNYRMAEAAWPYWSNWSSPDSPLQASPTIQFGWNEFAYYYIKE